MKLVLILLGLVVAASAAGDIYERRWKVYKARLGSNVHQSLEEAVYKKQFIQSYKEVEENNMRFRSNQSTFKMQINDYSHLPEEEFLKLRTGLKPLPEPKKPAKWTKGMKGPLPDSLDWAAAGFTTSAKDQGKCGSCYSFAAAAATEGQAIKLHGLKVDLSNQQIIDCSGSYGNLGCDGGFHIHTMSYIEDNGLSAFASYPYEGKQGTCRNNFPALARVTSHERFTYVDRTTLKQMLATYGPIVATMKVKRTLNSYKGGFFIDISCTTKTLIKELNHAVLLVGYGRMGGHEYWKVKNSWGEKWGEAGYFYISQAYDCGITTDVVVPNY